MTHFDVANWIREQIATEMSMFYIYNWSDEYKLSKINEFESRIKSTKGYFDIDPRKFTYEEMIKLGFRRWSEEDKLMLIPLWLLPFLIYYIPTVCIDGIKYYHKEAVDTDHRFGCLAYGIECDEIANKEENKLIGTLQHG